MGSRHKVTKNGGFGLAALHRREGGAENHSSRWVMDIPSKCDFESFLTQKYQIARSPTYLLCLHNLVTTQYSMRNLVGSSLPVFVMHIFAATLASLLCTLYYSLLKFRRLLKSLKTLFYYLHQVTDLFPFILLDASWMVYSGQVTPYVFNFKKTIYQTLSNLYNIFC